MCVLEVRGNVCVFHADGIWRAGLRSGVIVLIGQRCGKKGHEQGGEGSRNHVTWEAGEGAEDTVLGREKSWGAGSPQLLFK